MRRLGLLFLLLWMELRTHTHAYPIAQAGQPNLSASDVRLFACQNYRGCIPNLSKRKPWRHQDSDGYTDSPSDSDDEPPPYERPHHHHHHYDGEDDNDGENTDEYNPDPWMELTSETWTDPEAEPQTEWQSASTPADSDSPTTPTDSYYSRGTPTPTSPPASDSAPVAGPSVASNTNSNSAYRPSSSRGSNSAPSPSSSSSPSPHTTSAKPTSTLGTTRSATPTANKTSSTSTTSYDMIRPNTSSSLHIVAVITITPESSPNDPNTTNTNDGGVIDPYPTPARNPYNSGTDSDQSRNANGVVSSQNVPLAVIVGSVFGIVFGGLALFCVLFGINKLRQRKQDSVREQRSRRLRMGAGTGSSSTIMLARGPEASGGSIHTNEHGDGGILVRETSDSPTGSGRGWIRFANQRRPSSVPVLPEVKDHSNTPLMQEWNSPSSVHPPKPQFMERDHSPNVPSPLRTNRVTGRDSPSGWI